MTPFPTIIGPTITMEDQFPNGTTVVVSGLVSQAHLNGTTGTIKSWKSKMSRYLVILATGEKIALKHESLSVPKSSEATKPQATEAPAVVNPAAPTPTEVVQAKGPPDYSTRAKCCLCKSPLRLDNDFQHPLVCCASLMCNSCFNKDVQNPDMACPSCKGTRPTTSSKEYVELMLKRVDEGHGWALAIMSDVYIHGHAGYKATRDLNVSRGYLERAAALGNTTASCNLAQFYLRPNMGVARDPKKAYALLQAAAAKGNLNAIFYMGQMHEKGDGVKQSWTDAKDFYMIAAKEQHPPACLSLGLLFVQGKAGLPKDLQAAKELWTVAAKAGLKDAIENLQKLNQMMGQNKVQVRETTTTTGGITSVDKIVGVKGEDLISKVDACINCKNLLAVDSAQSQPNACCNTICCLACCMQFAKEKRDKCCHCQASTQNKGSAEYLQVVQQRADDENVVWAIAAMAEVHMFGHPSKLIEKDNDKARNYLERAVEAGHTVSMVNLAAFYMDGSKGVERDYAKAHGLYVKAACLGNISAVYNMGQMHERGDGVQQSWKETITLFNMAAARGYPPAQFALGLIFAKGEVVAQNFTMSKQLWTHAAQQGFPAAIQALEQLVNVEAAAQRVEAAKKAKADVMNNVGGNAELSAAMEELETMD